MSNYGNFDAITPTKWGEILDSTVTNRKVVRNIFINNHEVVLLPVGQKLKGARQLLVSDIVQISHDQLEKNREKIKQGSKTVLDNITGPVVTHIRNQNQSSGKIRSFIRSIALKITFFIGIEIFGLKKIEAYKRQIEHDSKKESELKSTLLNEFNSLCAEVGEIESSMKDRNILREIGFKEGQINELLTVDQYVPLLIKKLANMNKDHKDFKETERQLKDYYSAIQYLQTKNNIPFKAASGFLALAVTYSQKVIPIVNSQSLSVLQLSINRNLNSESEDIREEDGGKEPHQFKIDMQRGIVFLRKDLSAEVEDETPVPAQHHSEQDCVEDGSKAIEALIRVDEDKPWVNILKSLVTQSTHNKALSNPLYHLKRLMGEIDLTGTYSFLEVDYPNKQFSPIELHIVRDEKQRIQRVHLKLIAKQDLIQNKGESHVLVEDALTSTFEFDIRLIDGKAVSSNIQRNVSTNLTPFWVKLSSDIMEAADLGKANLY